MTFIHMYFSCHKLHAIIIVPVYILNFLLPWLHQILFEKPLAVLLGSEIIESDVFITYFIVNSINHSMQILSACERITRICIRRLVLISLGTFQWSRLCMLLSQSSALQVNEYVY